MFFHVWSVCRYTCSLSKQHSRCLQHLGKVFILCRSLICSRFEPFRPEEQLLYAEGEIFLVTQPFIYDICIYSAIKYGNVEVYLYLKRGCASRVAPRCRCTASGKSLKDLGEVIHHRLPFLYKGLLGKHFDRILCALVFLFIPHGRQSGFERMILQRFNQFEP